MQHLPIHPSLLHPLTGEPLTAVGVLPSGRVVWPIMGGDGTDDDANDKADDDKGEADDGADSDKDDASDDDKDKDWKAEFEAQQRINRSLERRTRKDAQRIKQLEDGPKKPDDKGDDQPDPERIRADAKAEAQREVLHGRVEDKIEAKARAFADPEDAVAVLLRSHDYDDFLDDSKIDVEAITDALKELGEKKPHLLAQGGKKFQGDPDGGPRKDGTGRPKNLGDALARHYSKR